jgi:hypothetical protein
MDIVFASDLDDPRGQSPRYVDTTTKSLSLRVFPIGVAEVDSTVVAVITKNSAIEVVVAVVVVVVVGAVDGVVMTGTDVEVDQEIGAVIGEGNMRMTMVGTWVAAVAASTTALMIEVPPADMAVFLLFLLPLLLQWRTCPLRDMLVPHHPYRLPVSRLSRRLPSQ